MVLSQTQPPPLSLPSPILFLSTCTDLWPARMCICSGIYKTVAWSSLAMRLQIDASKKKSKWLCNDAKTIVQLWEHLAFGVKIWCLVAVLSLFIVLLLCWKVRCGTTDKLSPRTLSPIGASGDTGKIRVVRSCLKSAHSLTSGSAQQLAGWMQRYILFLLNKQLSW